MCLYIEDIENYIKYIYLLKRLERNMHELGHNNRVQLYHVLYTTLLKAFIVTVLVVSRSSTNQCLCRCQMVVVLIWLL